MRRLLGALAIAFALVGTAMAHPGPVELNQADRQTLLRVPGIGPKSADTILQARRRGRLQELRDLQQLGINANRAAPYILLNGRAPNHQPRLF